MAGARFTFPQDGEQRTKAITAAIAAGDLPRAIVGVRLELRCGRFKQTDVGTLVILADAFHKSRVHPVAFEVYQEFLTRAAPDDVRRPEVAFRAGLTAARHLRLYAAALPLLEKAADSHEEPQKAAMAAAEAMALKEALAVVVPQTDDMLLSGPVTVLRRTSGRIDISKVGRIVSETGGRALADVTQMLRSSVGIIAADLEPIVAKRVAGRLQEEGVPAMIIPADRLVALPAAESVRLAGVDRRGIHLAVAGKGTPVVLKQWDKVFYASAGRVRSQRMKTAFVDTGVEWRTGFYGGMGVKSGAPGWSIDPYRKRTEVVENTTVDIFTLDPFQCYRFVDGETGFLTLEVDRTQKRHSRLCDFMCEFLGCGIGVPIGEGAWISALDVTERRWRELTFDSITNFDRYNYWRLQLEQYG